MCITFDNSNIILFADFNLDTYCIGCLRIIVVWEVHTNDTSDCGFIIFVFPQKVLDVFVLS
jgi:hypothetical protein